MSARHLLTIVKKVVCVRIIVAWLEDTQWPFDKAKADTICDLVAEGRNLHVIGKLKGSAALAHL